MTQIIVESGTPLTGACRIPGDKSISHRSVIFGGIADGKSHIRGFLDGGDCRSTIGVLRGLGVVVEEISPTELIIHGRGLDGLQEPNNVLDCGNSGTTIRMMTGLLVGQRFTSFLTGSEQIRRRPMGRIVKPLRGMGADVMGRQDGNLAPLGIRPARLRGFEYTMTVASSQVKSSLLLAGLYAQGITSVREPGPARDHTERMLMAMGVPIEIYGSTVHIDRPSTPLKPLDITVPGDPSSAAFLIVAASIIPGSRITIQGVCVNPTRDGIMRALQEMGGQVIYYNQRQEGGEAVADIEVSYSELQGATFGGEQIVTMIDELPALALAATQAKGRTLVRDASELRVKETDRIATIVSELRKMGAKIEPTEDGFIVDGPTRLIGSPAESHGDHRLAMVMAVAGLLAQGSTTVYEAEVTADSFPGFELTLQALGGKLRVEA